MHSFNKIAIITLLACISSLQATDNLKVIETKPNELGVLTQIKSFVETKTGETLYSYKCTVGQIPIGRVGCTGNDHITWPTPHNVELTLRCPPNGVTNSIAYVEINYTVSSQSVNCIVSSGGIGHNFIEIKISSWGTYVLNYDAKFNVY